MHSNPALIPSLPGPAPPSKVAQASKLGLFTPVHPGPSSAGDKDQGQGQGEGRGQAPHPPPIGAQPTPILRPRAHTLTHSFPPPRDAQVSTYFRTIVPSHTNSVSNTAGPPQRREKNEPAHSSRACSSPPLPCTHTHTNTHTFSFWGPSSQLPGLIAPALSLRVFELVVWLCLVLFPPVTCAANYPSPPNNHLIQHFDSIFSGSRNNKVRPRLYSSCLPRSMPG